MYAVNPDGLAKALALLADVLDPESLGPRARPGGNEACCQ